MAEYENNSHACVCAKGYTGKHCETGEIQFSVHLQDCFKLNWRCNSLRMTQSLVVYRFLVVIEYFQIVPLIHFRVNFFQCSDIDECSASIWPCDVNANCQNSYGSYACSCKCGFYGNGKACVYRGKRPVCYLLVTLLRVSLIVRL